MGQLTSMLYDFLMANISRFFWAAATAIILIRFFQSTFFFTKFKTHTGLLHLIVE